MSELAIGHIASVIVQALPAKADAVVSAIKALPEADVFAREQGKIVAVLEAEKESRLSELINQMQNFEGVLSASLVYHHAEE